MATPKTWKEFSDRYDLAYLAQTGRMQGNKLGFELTHTGEYIAANEQTSFGHQQPFNPMDPRQQNGQGPRYYPDVPYPQPEMRDDLAAMYRPRPR